MSALAPRTAPPATELKLASYVAWLSKVGLFHEIKDDTAAMNYLAGIMHERTYPEGTRILQDGHEGAEAYFLMIGSVKVLKTTSSNDVFPVAALDAKDHPFFGEAALLQNDLRSATITCDVECRCLILERSEFEVFCRAYPEWALPIVRKIGCVVLERLHRANSDLVLLYNALVSEVKGWNG